MRQRVCPTHFILAVSFLVVSAMLVTCVNSLQLWWWCLNAWFFCFILMGIGVIRVRDHRYHFANLYCQKHTKFVRTHLSESVQKSQGATTLANCLLKIYSGNDMGLLLL
jgi:hypothetical protein